MLTENNKEKNTSRNRKKVLFISLFIVPFLVGMALIFIGKNIATLPILHPEDQEFKDDKKVTTYYRIPEFSFTSLSGKKVEFLNSDSSLFLLTLFQSLKEEEWEKHMMYHTKIIERYSNAKFYTIYEGSAADFVWTEDPIPFFKRFDSWEAGFMPNAEFNLLIKNLKLLPDSITGMYPYVLVDKEKHIRAYCNINDLKAARDIPKMFKILNNQYAPKRAKLTQKRE